MEYDKRSPYLLRIYLDKISVQLGAARAEGIVSNMVVNHLLFAYDICVFGPNISSLQRLLKLCCALVCC